MTSRFAVETLSARYLARLLDADREGALRVLFDEGLARGVSPHELFVDVVAVAQREVGARWQRNELTIADEHLATAISQLALARLYTHLTRAARNGRVVLLACVEGEQHDMGPRIACDLLDAAGFDVRYLGADVPVAALASAVERHRPALVALSATLSVHLAALRDAVACVRAVAGPSVPIVVGGAALDAAPPALAAALRVHVSTGTARELVARIEDLLDVSASRGPQAPTRSEASARRDQGDAHEDLA